MVKVHVGCVVITWAMPENELAAFCRIRTQWNMDGPGHTRKLQSYRGGHQLTFKGKPRPDKVIDKNTIIEDPEENILPRTALREIGLLATIELLTVGDKFRPQLMVCEERDGITHKTYVAYRPLVFQKLLQTDISGHTVILTENMLRHALPIDRKQDKDGIPEGVVKFFDDELQAVRLAFAKAHEVGIESLAPHFNRPMITDAFDLLAGEVDPNSVKKLVAVSAEENIK